MALILGTYGFSPYERQLVQEQLKVVDAKAKHQWMYIGETTEANLLLAKQPCTEGKQSVQVRLYQPVDKNTEVEGILYIDTSWPIRLFKLLDIVLKTETIISSNNDVDNFRQTSKTNDIQPSSALIKKIQSLKSGLSIYDPSDNFLASVHEQNRRLVIKSAYSANVLGKQLRKHGNCNTGKTPANLPAADHSYPIISLLWDLELEANTTASEVSQWEAQRYQLAQWPDFKWLRTGDNVLRLSAAFTKRPLSIHEAAQLLKVEPAVVVRFLKACTTVGLRINDSRIADSRPVQQRAPNEQQGRQLSLLASLRNRLKTAFS